MDANYPLLGEKTLLTPFSLLCYMNRLPRSNFTRSDRNISFTFQAPRVCTPFSTHGIGNVQYNIVCDSLAF